MHDPFINNIHADCDFRSQCDPPVKHIFLAFTLLFFSEQNKTITI